MSHLIINGDNLELLKKYPDNHFDAIVTDPPYGLGKEPDAVEVMTAWATTGYHEIEGKGFMGKEWDAFVPQPVFWKEVFRVLKHGGHVVAFYGTRTYDWGVMAMRFAGFEVRDCIQWLYGSGFPKSHNISKAIDKKPNLQYIKEWKKWLENEINKSEKSQKQINDECNFNAIGYARYDSNDYWATNRPTKEKWDKMKSVIGINTNEWDYICDSNADERGYIESRGGLAGGSGNTVGRFTGKELSNNSISEDAKRWDGWGSALKPANEPIVLARKPLEKGLSIAENVLKWGTGGINIDGCRVSTNDKSYFITNDDKSNFEGNTYGYKDYANIHKRGGGHNEGRFPANIILTHHPECECKGVKKVKAIKGGSGEATMKSGNGKNGIYGKYSHNKIGENAGGLGDENGQETVEDWNCHPDCPIKILDEQSGILKSGDMNGEYNGFGYHEIYGKAGKREAISYGDKGGASRFFYVAKASKSERNNGLRNLELKQTKGGGGTYNEEAGAKYGSIKAAGQNFHPTVKPVKLMQYLVRLVTPPNGIVLDPFCGSGTTGVACKLEGFQFVGMEQDPEYAKIAEARIENYKEEKESPIKDKIDTINSKFTQQTLF